MAACVPSGQRPSATVVRATMALLTSLIAQALPGLTVTFGGPFVVDAPPAPASTTGQATLVRALSAALNAMACPAHRVLLGRPGVLGAVWMPAN